MIHLKLRTEYSFRLAYGKIPDVIRVADEGQSPIAITDFGGTWGHVQWMKECKKAGTRPLFGVELPVVRSMEKEKWREGAAVVIARTDAGLANLYQLVSVANQADHFYYVPRVTYEELDAFGEGCVVLAGPGLDLDRLWWESPWLYAQLSPEDARWNRQVLAAGVQAVACCDAYYPTPEDRGAYEVLVGDGRRTRTSPMHLMDEWALRAAVPGLEDHHFANAYHIAQACDAHLPKAEGVRPPRPDTLYDMCIEGARQRGLAVRRTVEPIGEQGHYLAHPIELEDETYQARLERELALIAEKGFEDYFYVISDIVRFAKQHMLVGPARGSSAGSLACYLLSITDVDPIRHDLMFERFIDVTRADLPDVDIDFQDDKRDLVVAHLRSTYGAERVGRIGTVMKYKAKSTLTDVGKALNIPEWDMHDVKEAVIERSTGDARAQFCIQDALESLDVGKALVAKYPHVMVASQLEGHARQSGQHAAGLIVCQEPITQYCSVDRSGAAQIDKKDAEVLNLLKIDALGLRTLSVIQDCLDQIGKDREWLVEYPLDDTDAFELFNAERYSGIFQYEGYALQSLTRQMKIRNFDDIVIITALARPGPLHCGAATEFIARRIGEAPVVHLHPLAADLTSDTYGTVIYQEQVMAMGRRLGSLSWEDVSELRKAMSKSLGEEFFNTYWEKFEKGANAQGIPTMEARRVWDKMCTFGSWAFNKSHAVSYGLISYWCAVLKAHWPLEYAAACLRNAKDNDQAIKILRDLAEEGFSYVPVDPRRSGLTWSVVDGKLLGGLTNIKGIGRKTASDIIRRRDNGISFTPGQAKNLIAPVTPFDDIFEGRRRWGDLYANPKKYSIVSGGVTFIKDIGDPGEYVFLGKLKEKNLRDLNEYGNVVKRGGKLVKSHNLFLNMVVEDDTGSIIVRINRYDYAKWGKPIVEQGREGDWYLWKGVIRDDGWRLVQISKHRRLTADTAEGLTHAKQEEEGTGTPATAE